MQKACYHCAISLVSLCNKSGITMQKACYHCTVCLVSPCKKLVITVQSIWHRCAKSLPWLQLEMCAFRNVWAGHASVSTLGMLVHQNRTRHKRDRGHRDVSFASKSTDIGSFIITACITTQLLPKVSPGAENLSAQTVAIMKWKVTATEEKKKVNWGM